MTDTPAPVAQPLSAAERIERAEREVIRLTGSGPGGQRDRNFRMTIPAEPDRDSDLVLMDGLAAGREALATLDAARSVPDNAALREAREHIADGHRCDETRGDCLGHMEDVYASLMWPAAAPASPAGLDPRVIEAFDLLGGMWSWHDASITAEPGKPGGLSETWYVSAGRILREVVGRPAQYPAALASPEEASRG